MKNRMTAVVLIVVLVLVLVLLAIGFVERSSFMGGQSAQTSSQTSGQNSGQGTSGTQPTTVSFACSGGKLITAQFNDGTSTPTVVPGQPPVPTGSVDIALSDGRTMTLTQTLSADGGRYSNTDGSFVFWTKGNGLMVLENNVQKNYTGCMRIANVPDSSNLPQVYQNEQLMFTLRFPSVTASSSKEYPDSYNVNEQYAYTLIPGESIAGVKFTIPSSFATGTNLSEDTYISVESVPLSKATSVAGVAQVQGSADSCSANLFLDNAASTVQEDQNGTTYSVASSSGAAAGNRYEETVYALPGTNPCIAVRYFIHYSEIGNYPPGAVKQFDEAALKSQFDQIRQTLVVNQ